MTLLKKNKKLKNFVLDSKMLKVLLIFNIGVDTLKFKEGFEAAQKFNLLVKEEKTEELVMAPVVEDKEEVIADDADVNKPADDKEDDD